MAPLPDQAPANRRCARPPGEGSNTAAPAASQQREKCWWKNSQMLDVMFMIRVSVVGGVVLLCLSVSTLGG